MTEAGSAAVVRALVAVTSVAGFLLLLADPLARKSPPKRSMRRALQ